MTWGPSLLSAFSPTSHELVSCFYGAEKRGGQGKCSGENSRWINIWKHVTRRWVTERQECSPVMLGHEGPPGGSLSLRAGPQRGHIPVTARDGSATEHRRSFLRRCAAGPPRPRERKQLLGATQRRAGKGPALEWPVSICPLQPLVIKSVQPAAKSKELWGEHPRAPRGSCP